MRAPDDILDIRVHHGHPHRMGQRMAGREGQMIWKNITNHQCSKTPGLTYSPSQLHKLSLNATPDKPIQADKGGTTIKTLSNFSEREKSLNSPFYLVHQQCTKFLKSNGASRTHGPEAGFTSNNFRETDSTTFFKITSTCLYKETFSLLLYLHRNDRIIKTGCFCNWQPIQSSLPSLAHSHGVCKSFIEFRGICLQAQNAV